MSSGLAVRVAGLFYRAGVRVISPAPRTYDFRPAVAPPLKAPRGRSKVKTKRPPVPLRARTGIKTKRVSGRTPAPAPWHKAEPISLKASARLDDAIATIATACRDHWQSNLPAALAGDHPEGIHQVRVGLRRFRVLLSLLGDFIPEDQRTWLRVETKTLGDALGPARDLDVFLTDLLTPLTGKAAYDSQVAVLLRAVREARDSAYTVAVAALASARYRRFMTRLNTWLEGHGWDGPTKRRGKSAQAFARTVLNRRLAKIADRTKSLKSMGPAKLHALRITIKKLRYGLEFFHAVLPEKRADRVSHNLKALQDALGYVNDLDVAKRTVAMLSEQTRDPKVRAAILAGGHRLTKDFDEAAKAALPRAARAASRLRAEKPL
jgi:triphosphatase